MARQRNWERLQDATRQRYERAGISRSDYLSGMSLKIARGHGTTPEHPGDKPQAGQEQYFVNKIVTETFGDRRRFRGPKDIENPPEGKTKPTLEDIEYVLELSEYEIEQLAKNDDYWWLWYH